MIPAMPGAAALGFLLMLLAAIFGYVGGWLFGVVFNDTWAAIHTWLQMPAALTPGMLGAFMAAFGSFIGKNVTTKKD